MESHFVLCLRLLLAAVLGGCLRFFRRVLFFIVREPWLLGWSAAGGPGLDPELPSRLRVPLDEPSVFQTVIRDKTLFLGRLGADPQSQALLRAVGKKPTTSAALFPIVVRGRVVNVVYGDNGPNGNVRSSLGELLVLVQKVPRAYLRIIRGRIEETRKGPRGPETRDETKEQERRAR